MQIQSALSFVAMSLLGLAPMASREAVAAAELEVVWTLKNNVGIPGSPKDIDAAPGDTLVAEIRISPDAQGVVAYGVSLAFDTDFGDELDLLGVTEFTPDIWSPLTNGVKSMQESNGGQEGQIRLIEAVAFSQGPTSGTFVIAEVEFEVTGQVASDGEDVFVGTFDSQDGVGNNAFALITADFFHAAVNAGFQCSDGVDNDGDGAVDFGADWGCASPTDDSERRSILNSSGRKFFSCDDGVDNDLDGLIDYGSGLLNDPGCLTAPYYTESPQCNDGLDNESLFFKDFLIDFGSDPQCATAWDNNERRSGAQCGLGFELAFALPPLMWLHRRRRSALRPLPR